MSSIEQQGHSGGGRSLREAIRQARTTQADHLDGIAEVNVAEMARLELLMSELEPVLAEMPVEADQFQCALTPGDPPRVWIDMISYVAMAPDKRTYRFVTDSRSGRSIRLETTDVAELADFATQYLAHRMIDRERSLEAGPLRVEAGESFRYGGMAVILAFLCGTCFGALALFVLALVLSAP